MHDRISSIGTSSISTLPPDIGCNLGLFSLMVAADGGTVVAVDGMEDNLAYIWYSRLWPAIDIHQCSHLDRT